MAALQDQRSVPDVLKDIAGNLEDIARSEFRLTKAELKEEFVQALKPAVILAVGSAFGFYAIGFLLLAAVYGLTRVMAGWLAALLVGAVLALVAIPLLRIGMKRFKRVGPIPDKTIQSLEENVQWAKQQVK